MNRFNTIGKSKQFYDFLKNEIVSGEYKAGDKFPSIRELAFRYGISNITVNSVISNLVTEGLLYVVQGRGTFVAERKQQSKKKRKMIGVMLFDFSLESNVEGGIFNSIQQNLKDDYYVVPYNSYDKLELFYKGIKGFAELEADGMILVPPTSEDYDSATVKSLMAPGTPVVFINRNIPGIEADFLAMDFAEAAYQSVKHLIRRKRKKIILLKPDSASLSNQMCDGYRRAYEEAGLDYNEEFFIEWHRSMEKAKEDLRALLDSADGLVGSDGIIYKLRKTFEDANIEIPGQLSIVGINDTVYSRFMRPRLTAVPFPSEAIGEAAARAVMDKIEATRTENMHRLFDSKMIIRESS